MSFLRKLFGRSKSPSEERTTVQTVVFRLDFESADEQLCSKLVDLVDESVQHDVPDGIIEYDKITLIPKDKVVLVPCRVHAKNVFRVQASFTHWWIHHGKRLKVVQAEVEDSSPYSFFLGKGQMFSQLSLEEKQRALELNETQLLMIQNARQLATNVPIPEIPSFVDKMTDSDIMEAIQLSRLVHMATEIKNHQQAITLFEQILIRAPFDSTSMMSIGVRYANLGDAKKAIDHLEKALQINPKNQRIHNNLQAVKQHFGRV
jgi:tetratricopeptide (TPR) repeat protein